MCGIITNSTLSVKNVALVIYMRGMSVNSPLFDRINITAQSMPNRNCSICWVHFVVIINFNVVQRLCIHCGSYTGVRDINCVWICSLCEELNYEI